MAGSPLTMYRHGQGMLKFSVPGMSWMCSTKGSSEGSCNAQVVSSGLNRWEVWWTWVFHAWGLNFSLSRLSFNINRKILKSGFFFGLLSCFFPLWFSCYNCICPGKDYLLLCAYACKKRQLLPTGRWVCWSLLQNGWLCYCTAFCSACSSQKSQGHGRGLLGFFVPFTCHCRVILFHLPPLIMQQLWEERKEVAEPSKHWAALGSFVSPLLAAAPHRAGKGKAGDASCAERSISHLTGKSNNSLKVPILTPHQCQVGCKIHMDISKTLGADFLS